MFLEKWCKMNEINEKKEQINQINNEINNLNRNINENSSISGEYADFYKKQVNKISNNTKEINNMMDAASEIEKKVNYLLNIKENIELNIKKIVELNEILESLNNTSESQQEIEKIQNQIDVLNEDNINKKEEYDAIISTIENIISQY